MEKITIEIGTDLTQLTTEQIQDWVLSHNEANNGPAAKYRAWQDAAAYLVWIQFKGGVAHVAKAIIGEPFEFK